MKMDFVQRRCVRALICSILMTILVFAGVVYTLIMAPTVDCPNNGYRALRMFTTISNILAGFSCALCIPFEIEGLRYHDYHLPRWVVYTLYMGSTGVVITFVIVLCVLTPGTNFRYTFMTGSAPLLHLVCPLLAALLFIFINNDHHISKKMIGVSLLPLFIYSIVYLVMVVMIGEEKGGWNDFYCFNTYVPWYFTLPGVYGFAFLSSNIIRILHNKMHAQAKEKTKDYYLHSDEYDHENIDCVIKYLALKNRKTDISGDLIVPRRIIYMLKERYEDDRTIDELLKLYLSYFFKD